MAGGLVKKAQVHTDWPGLKRKELFEGRDLNSTIDSRAIYASAMSTVFDVDFKKITKEVFWGENLPNLSDKLFKALMKKLLIKSIFFIFIILQILNQDF